MVTISGKGVPVILFGSGDVLVGSCSGGVLKFKASDFCHDIGPISLDDTTWRAGRDLFFFHFSNTKSVDVLVQALLDVKAMMETGSSFLRHAQPDREEGSE